MMDRMGLILLLFLASVSYLGAYEAPFMTDADMEIYLSDTEGIVRMEAGEHTFVRPGISGIRVDGEEAAWTHRGEGWLQAIVPPGQHRIAVISGSEHPPPCSFPAADTSAAVVRSVKELETACNQSGPGAEIVIANGTYVAWKTTIACSGSAEAPVTIRPEMPGSVTFTGETRLSFAGDHIIFKGFRFVQTGHTTVAVRGGDDNRFTQCHFFYCGPAGSTFGHIFTIDIESDRNRVDHCFWTGSKCMSLGLRGSPQAPEKVGKHNRFDHNIFRDIERIWINGQENIQLGQGFPWDARPETLVEYNLFDYAWGDSEIFSSKTSGNIFRYNVAAHCIHSAFTLRGGNDVIVDSNIMFNDRYGIIIYGKNHRISNNLVMDCIENAVCYRVGHIRGKSHGIPATNCLIAHNTFINNGAGIGVLGATDRRDWMPSGNRVVNNIFSGGNGAYILESGIAASIVSHNLYDASHVSANDWLGEEALVADPMFENSGSEVTIAAQSPAKDAAVIVPEATHDRLGRPRPYGNGPDMGADEVGPLPADLPILPPIPPERFHDIELYKNAQMAAFNAEQPNEDFFRGDISPDNGSITLNTSRVEVAEELPEHFLVELKYQPDAFATETSLILSDPSTGNNYRLHWGKTDGENAPSGLIFLEKNGTRVAEGADTVYYRRNYVPSFPGNMIAIKRTTPIPGLWYAMTIMMSHSRITVVLNVANRSDKGSPATVRRIPVLVWEDEGTLGGPAFRPKLAALETKGAGRVAEMSLWRAEYIGNSPPPAPADITAVPEGGNCVRLEWHSTINPAVHSYQVFRAVIDNGQPSQPETILNRVHSTGYADFDVTPGKEYLYSVQTVNLEKDASLPVSVRVNVQETTPRFLVRKAEDYRHIEAPMRLCYDKANSRKYVSGIGPAAMSAPPENGYVDYEIEVSQPAKYAMWALVLAPSEGANSFHVAMSALNDGTSVQFHTPVSQEWNWIPMDALGGPLGLTKGSHRIRFYMRESGTRLSALLLTTDLTWQPPH